jgi:hypothetical protein
MSFDIRAANEILKVVYGCVIPLLVRWRFIEVPRAKAGRHACEARLAQARKRKDAWEIDVHKGHLVSFDREILRRRSA